MAAMALHILKIVAYAAKSQFERFEQSFAIALIKSAWKSSLFIKHI